MKWLFNISIILGFTVYSCGAESPENEEVQENLNDSLSIGECIYANQFGEIKLLADTDSSWRFQISSNGALKLDTVLYTYGPLSFGRIISDDNSPGHNLKFPFILAPYSAASHQHSMTFLEHIVVDYNYVDIISSGLISAMNYGWIGREADMQTIVYLERFYRIGKDVTVSGDIQNLKGGPRVDNIYIESELPDSDGPNEEWYYHITGTMSLEEYPEGFYSTDESPQGMIPDGETQYRLVFRDCEYEFPEPFIYTGTALNSSDGKACIAWDFADSEIYQLAGKEPWEEDEIGNRISVQGYYTFSPYEGSILRNWSIVE